MKRLIAALMLAAIGSANADPVAGTLTFTITQKPGTAGKIIPSLTWSTEPDASRCVASGDWTGARAVDKTTPLVLAEVTPPKTYILTCGWDDTDVKLSWVPPTQNADGSALTDLAGYKIYYGSDPANLANVVQVTNPATSSYDLKNLAAGVYHFALTALNAGGKESARTPTVSATLGTADKAATRTIEGKIPSAPGSLVVTP